MATMKELYDSWLDEIPLDQLSVRISTSTALEACDPVAYRCGFADFADSSRDGGIQCEDCNEDLTGEDLDDLGQDDTPQCRYCRGAVRCPKCDAQIERDDADEFDEHKLCAECREKAEKAEEAKDATSA